MTEQELRIKIASILQSRAFENAPSKDDKFYSSRQI